jgi:hypothetical protein
MDSSEAITLSLEVSHEALRLIGEIDEFKGRWEALSTLSPERLRALRHVATVESVGSSTRIEGVKLSDREVEALLSNLGRFEFKSRDEEEVAGYAEPWISSSPPGKTSRSLRTTSNSSTPSC